jgi:hypothetical protein
MQLFEHISALAEVFMNQTVELLIIGQPLQLLLIFPHNSLPIVYCPLPVTICTYAAFLTIMTAGKP